MKKSLAFYLILVFTMFLCSCNNDIREQNDNPTDGQSTNQNENPNGKLTRPLALKILKRGYPMSYTKNLIIQDHSMSSGSFIGELKICREKGLLSYTQDQQGFGDVIFTDLGKKYYIEGSKRGYLCQVIIYTVDIGEITGIIESTAMGQNFTVVEFTEKVIDKTPFCEDYDKIEVGHVTAKKIAFSKYDDGWRINKNL